MWVIGVVIVGIIVGVLFGCLFKFMFLVVCWKNIRVGCIVCGVVVIFVFSEYFGLEFLLVCVVVGFIVVNCKYMNGVYECEELYVVIVIVTLAVNLFFFIFVGASLRLENVYNFIVIVVGFVIVCFLGLYCVMVIFVCIFKVLVVSDIMGEWCKNIEWMGYVI